MKRVKRVFLCLACMFAMVLTMLPVIPAKADERETVLGEFMYLNDKGQTVDVYHEFENVDSNMTCKDFYEQYMVPYTAELTGVKTPDSWHDYPISIGTDNEQYSWSNSETKIKDAPHYGFDIGSVARMDYYGIYTGYKWVCYGYEVLYGEENWLDSGTGFMACVPDGETSSQEVLDAVKAAASQQVYINDWMNAYEPVISLYYEGGADSYTYYVIDMEVPVVEGQTVISPSERIEIALDGSEQRKITSSDSKEIMIVSDLGTVPTGSFFKTSYLNSGDEYDKAVTTITSSYNNKTTMAIMSMDLMDANQSAIHQLDGKVQVVLPVPDILKNAKAIKVYRVEGDQLVECTVTIENGSLTFETDHFSIYAFVAEGEEEAQDTADVATGAAATEKETSAMKYILIAVGIGVVLFVVIAVLVANVKTKKKDE